MGQRIIKFLRGQIVTSILYILLGAALVFAPVETVNIICKIVFGIMLAAAGLIHIILYVLERPTTTVFDLFSGVILVVFGVFLFQNPQIIVKVLPILLGGFVLGDSVWTLRGAFRLKKAKSGAWTWVLIGTLIFIALGITMIINPFTVIRYMIIFCGAVLLANGVIDLVFQFVLYRGIKNAEKRLQELAAVEDQEHSAEETVAANPDEPVYEEWKNRDAPIGTEEMDSGEDEAADDNQSPIIDEEASGETEPAEPQDTEREPQADTVPDSLKDENTDAYDTDSLKPELTLEPDLDDADDN